MMRMLEHEAPAELKEIVLTDHQDVEVQEGRWNRRGISSGDEAHLEKDLQIPHFVNYCLRVLVECGGFTL